MKGFELKIRYLQKQALPVLRYLFSKLDFSCTNGVYRKRSPFVNTFPVNPDLAVFPDWLIVKSYVDWKINFSSHLIKCCFMNMRFCLLLILILLNSLQKSEKSTNYFYSWLKTIVQP